MQKYKKNMQWWFIGLGYVLLCGIIICGCIWKAEKLVVIKNKTKSVVNAITIKYIVKYKPFSPTENEWYNISPYIAHACGEIDGMTYTNSREALEYSIDKGIRTLEIDFKATSDGIYVCRHSWQDDLQENKNWKENPPTYQEFMGTKILNLYTPMDLNDVMDYLKKYQDINIICHIQAGVEEEGKNFAEQIMEISKGGGTN